MQRAFAHFNKIVRSDIYSHNRINLMTGFFYTSLIQTFLAIRISVTVKMHMFHGVIRIGDDRKMDTIVTLLSALLFPGRFTKASVLFYRRFLKTVRGRWLGTVFGVFV